MQKTVQQSICEIDVYQFDEYYDYLTSLYPEEFLEDSEDLLRVFNFEFNTNLSIEQLSNFLFDFIERKDAKIIYKNMGYG